MNARVPAANAMISVVIPTFQEADVIEATLRRAAKTLRRCGEEFELIVVDDSGPGDATADTAEALAAELPVRVLRRPGRLGLATAVTDGWRAARGEVWGVMDGDLQHPPEVLGRLVEALQRPGVDVAIASRYVKGGLCPSWPRRRRAVSKLSTQLAALALPQKLASVHDPMSGMFLMRASVLHGVELDPIGYKILLEVLARGRWRELAEVPYRFEPRGFGRSKLGWRQSLEYLQHLARLARSTGQLGTWLRYATVGLSGAILDIGLFLFLIRAGSWPWAAALPAVIELALLNNFIWNNAITFAHAGGDDRRGMARRLLDRLGRYERACLVGAALNAATAASMLAGGASPASAASVGVLVGGSWNLVFNVPRIWTVWSAAASHTTAQTAPGSPATSHTRALPGNVRP